MGQNKWEAIVSGAYFPRLWVYILFLSNDVCTNHRIEFTEDNFWS